MPDQDRSQSATLDDQSKVKIKVQGEEKEVTFAELKELAQKGVDYTQKTSAVAEERRKVEAEKERLSRLSEIDEQLTANPELAAKVNKVLSDFEKGVKGEDPDKIDDALDDFDQLIKKATDPEEKEKLREAKNVILKSAEKVAREIIAKEREEIDAKFARIEATTALSVKERIAKGLDVMRDSFGEDIVGKYKKEITDMAIKYPQYTLTKIFYQVADDADIKTAIKNQAKTEEKSEIDRKKRAIETTDTGIIDAIDVPKDKRGVVDLSAYVRKVVGSIKR